MANPIGVTFMPSAQNAAMGPQQGHAQGDLADAFKVLSLHLPKVLSAGSLAPPSLLTSPGSAGIGGPGGKNPAAAVFEAILRAALGLGPQPSDGFAPGPPDAGSYGGSVDAGGTAPGLPYAGRATLGPDGSASPLPQPPMVSPSQDVIRPSVTPGGESRFPTSVPDATPPATPDPTSQPWSAETSSPDTYRNLILWGRGGGGY